MPKPYSNDLRDRAVAGVQAGESVRSVAAVLGVSASSVVKWSQCFLIVFGSIIVFYGCLNISHAVVSHWRSAAKINDNINALRIAVIDLANRLSYYAEKR